MPSNAARRSHWPSNIAFFLMGGVIGRILDGGTWRAYSDWRFYTILTTAWLVSIVVRWEEQHG